MILIRRVEVDGVSRDLSANGRAIYFLSKEDAIVVVDALNKIKQGKHRYEVYEG